MCTSLYKLDKNEAWDGNANKSLAGSLVSSLHRLKDVDNKGKAQHFRTPARHNSSPLQTLGSDTLSRWWILRFRRHLSEGAGYLQTALQSV